MGECSLRRKLSMQHIRHIDCMSLSSASLFDCFIASSQETCFLQLRQVLSFAFVLVIFCVFFLSSRGQAEFHSHS